MVPESRTGGLELFDVLADPPPLSYVRNSISDLIRVAQVNDFQLWSRNLWLCWIGYLQPLLRQDRACEAISSFGGER